MIFKLLKIARYLFISLWTLLPGFGLTQQVFSTSYKPGDKLFVCSREGLSLRELAGTNGKIIDVVPYGAGLEVQPNSKPPIFFTSSNITGTWAKVKYQNKEGYVFDGFLSRLKPMPVSQQERGLNDLIIFLKQQFKVSTETTTPPEKIYTDYYKIQFENGVEYESKNYEGGSVINVSFPVSTITFQEVFLLARQAYPEFFTRNKCPYQPGNMECNVDENTSLKLTQDKGLYNMWWGQAD
jgi:Bacterial SH3 domain